MSEEEAAEARAAGQAVGEYGAKVSALLSQLADLRAAAPPGAPPPKAVVFSQWGRLLRLVGGALKDNGIPYAAMMGTSQSARESALSRFQHDPDCPVLLLLMSNSSGAAGLTLTCATTAFILEPPLNPGLEAQAAARIHRLGQERPTRVVRLVTQDTVEDNVLAYSAWRQQEGGASGSAPNGGARGGGGGGEP
ncbi:MAG: P-loop containing nucleoside triphosphate hydrolase protein [Monoraphidium minutum]|nr:MAG: P-loop containing nucleoside triphosphate hydrolase protein [Monoraphidium minutum]